MSETRISLRISGLLISGLSLGALACSDDSTGTGTGTETAASETTQTGDGDGEGESADESGDGTGETGDGDGDPAGDGDGDPVGDGDGDPVGDGDGDPVGDGDGDAGCGDGVVDGQEECDLGPDNADNGACTSACMNAACGDGLVYEGVEACDDANLDETDACTSVCAAPACDDGLLSGDESDLDCGGSCDACDNGSLCNVSAECQSMACIEGSCGWADTCKGLLDLDPGLLDGSYMIDPDGEGGNDAFEAYCDMSTDGGGWTMLFHFYDHTDFSEQKFIDEFDHNRWTDEAWSYDSGTGELVAELPSLAPIDGQGMIDVGLMADAWGDLRMSCSQNDLDANEEQYAQVDGYAQTNGSHLLLGGAPNGVTYDVDPSSNSFGLGTIWHDNEPDSGNSGHYLCDYTNTGEPAGQFGFCYTDFLNNPNNLEQGDSIVALAFGYLYGPDNWSQGFTGECGDMDSTALLDAGSYSIWVR